MMRPSWDVGVRRYRYMLDEGVKGVGGQTWAPLAYAINAMALKEPMRIFQFASWPRRPFKRASWPKPRLPRPIVHGPWDTWPAPLPSSAGKKRIFFLARADSWGWDIRDGVYAAAKELGAEHCRV